MVEFVRTLLRDEVGATAIEYGLIASLVSVAAITAFIQVGGSVEGLFGFVEKEVADASVWGS